MIWRVFDLLVCFVEGLMGYMFFNQFLDTRSWLKQYQMSTFSVVYALSIFCGGFTATFGQELKIITAYCTIVVLACLFYQGSLKRKVLVAALFYCLLNLGDIIVCGIAIFINDITLQELLVWENIDFILLSIGCKGINFISIKCLGYLGTQTFRDLPKRIWWIMMAITIISIANVLATIEVLFYRVEASFTGYLATVMSLCILGINIGMYVVVKQINSYMRKDKELEIVTYQKEILVKETLEQVEANKEVRKMWHDFNNHISCVDMLLQMNNIEKARAYIKKMHASCEKTYMGIYTENDLADVIINQKYVMAKKYEIPLYVKGKFSEELKMDEVDLCALLSNGLDNAIEANIKIEDISKRRIDLIITLEDEYTKIEIFNPVAQNYEKNKVLQTTKADKKRHGIGMISMKNVVEKYGGKLEWKCEDDEFGLLMKIEQVQL